MFFVVQPICWVSGAGPYMKEDVLDKLESDTTPAIEVVYGEKDAGNVKISGTSAV